MSAPAQTLADWALEKHGMPAQSAWGPLEATVRLTLKQLWDMGLPKQLDEETITAMILGGLALNFRWCALAFGATHHGPSTCSWNQFNKNGSGANSESQTGADFALVLRGGDGMVRIAIFQAKKTGAGSRKTAYIDVHRRPDKPAGGKVWRPPQMLQIFEYASTFHADPALVALQDLCWVHYLGYTAAGEPVSVPLSSLTQQYTLEQQQYAQGSTNPNKVNVDQPGFRALREVIEEGLQAQLPPQSAWLETTWELAQAGLPNLMTIMDVHVGDASGDGAFVLALKSANSDHVGMEIGSAEVAVTPPPPPIIKVSRKTW